MTPWLPPLLLPWQAELFRDLLALSSDPERLAQVSGNLLSNAIKYVPDGTISEYQLDA